MPSPLRLAEPLRRRARPEGRAPALRSRRARPRRPPLRARDERRRDDLGDRDRLGGRPRRADRRHGGGRGDAARADAPAADARPPRSVARPASARSSCVATRRPTTRAARSTGRSPRTAGPPGSPASSTSPSAPTSTCASMGREVEGGCMLSEGETCFCALGWEEGADALPRSCEESEALLDATARGVARLAPPRPLPRPPVALGAAALGAHPEGPDPRAERRHGCGADHLAAGDPRRRAQLGLPLHLDPRRDLRALGPARARPRRRGDRLHGLHRGDLHGRSGPADHVRDRRREGADREHPRPPLRVRGSPARPDRQRRLQPASERSLRGAARLDLHPLAGAERGQRRALEAGAGAGRGGDRHLA